jgi:hypothetical protein
MVYDDSEENSHLSLQRAIAATCLQARLRTIELTRFM